LFFHRSRGIN